MSGVAPVIAMQIGEAISSFVILFACVHSQVCWMRWPAASCCQTATSWRPAFWPSTLRPAPWSTRCRGSASTLGLLLCCPEVWITRPSSSWAAPTACRSLGYARGLGLTPSIRGTRTPPQVRGCGPPNSCRAPPTCRTGAGGPFHISPVPYVVGCYRTVCPYRPPPSTGKCFGCSGNPSPFMEPVFTSARHWSLSRARWIQSTLLSYSFKVNFNIILPSTPRSFKWDRHFKHCEETSLHFSSVPCMLHAPAWSIYWSKSKRPPEFWRPLEYT
jgi:hypothetical protein